MSEHSELVTEMAFLEKMNTEDRLKLARKRRAQQLKKFSQREKEYHLSKRKRQDTSDNDTGSFSKKNSNYKVHFVGSVMLLEGATRNDVDEVKRLLMLGVSPDSTNEDGLTALHQCCIDNCEEMMLLLIEFGANVNAKDSEQWTPLHAAATCGHLHLIRILIEKGADLLAVNADGNMPYDICEDEQTLDYIESEMAKRGITQELIDETRAFTENQMLTDMRRLAVNGYDLNYRDSMGATPLHIASSNGYMSVVEFLLDHGASTDECDDDYWQPIHAAACWGHIDVIEYLVQNGADLDAKTKNGETPFDICEDPDLKSRILQLRSEIESKRAVHPNRLRRSHSQNTRSHSIRRTSIREKSAFAKREAIEEARLWATSHEDEDDARNADEADAGETLYNDFSRKISDESPIDLTGIDLKVDSGLEESSSYSNSPMTNNHRMASYNERSADLSSSQQQQQPLPGSIKSVSKKSTTSQSMESSYYSNYYNEYQEQKFPENGATGGAQPPPPRQHSNSHDSADSVKVEIHVTVNTNSNGARGSGDSAASNASYGATNSTGTLIDLKKQRSEKHRNSLGNGPYAERIKAPPHMEQPQAISQVSNKSMDRNSANNALANYQQSSGGPLTTGNHKSGNHHSGSVFDSPPSPTSYMKKFRGNPSELIGEEEKKGCCIIC